MVRPVRQLAPAPDDDMPTAEDTEAQFWSPRFRCSIRDNSAFFKRKLSDVSWAAFPLLKERIDTALADSTIDDDSVVSQQNLALDVIYKFVCGVNTRLNENQGMEFLEACTLFDARPKFKAKNFCKRWAGIT